MHPSAPGSRSKCRGAPFLLRFPAFSQKEQNGPFFTFPWRFQKAFTSTCGGGGLPSPKNYFFVFAGAPRRPATPGIPALRARDSSSAVRSGEWPAWFSFWFSVRFSGRWRAPAKGTAWAGFNSKILLLLHHEPGTHPAGSQPPSAIPLTQAVLSRPRTVGSHRSSVGGNKRAEGVPRSKACTVPFIE